MTIKEEAASLGLNVSMYLLLPPDKREEAIKQDIARERELRKEVGNGKNR